MSDDWHLAQVNIARAIEPMDAPAMAEFVANLEPVNALADTAPGFVWRLQDESGDATSIHVYDDELIIVNLSVWESMDALWEFVYSARHLEIMRRRREWFTRIAESHLALWWTPAGEVPDPWEARRRLGHLDLHGPTPHAFTFKRRFVVPDAAGEDTPILDERDPCPA
jgi:hypothetical protein